MLRDPSPIFDDPELPSLRRTKPLPKRRRTSESSSRDDGSSIMLPPDLRLREATQDSADALVSSDSLLALQSYYMPILGDMHDLLKTETEGGIFSSREYADAGGLFGTVRSGRGREEDSVVEGDYLDHFQQSGNTKKRKVPANLAVNGPGQESGSGGEGDDEPTDRAIPTGRPDHEYDAAGTANGHKLHQRKNRMSRATLAGLQHKEMLKSRKRQLAVVLGALTHGDTLALDQALSANNYPFTSGGSTPDYPSQETPKTRLSRRPVARATRAFKASQAKLRPSGDSRPFPSSDFTFTFHSATSDRLVATKEEVAALHARFAVELSRQAAKAAEVAMQTNSMLSGGSPAAKRSAKQGRTVSGQTANTKATPLEQSLGVPPQKTGKKKKRSALANASNPHHLRNYVPSRLPNSGQVNAAQALLNAQNLLSPFPTRFLSADVPPRRRRKASTDTVTPLTNPLEEWICPFCEYDLFYGDDADYQRAVNNRKKILKRRRRARERAAAAASGVAAALSKKNNDAAPAPTDDVNAEYEEESQPVESAPPVDASKHPLPKGNRRDDSRGRTGVAEGASG